MSKNNIAQNITIALAGNPNSGKTTIFNSITGTRQKVGNWPGVTVAKKEGTIERRGHSIKLVDLPGTYSLTPFSIEEIVARDYIITQAPDIVISIIDSSNLERSLYLATQIRELECKVLFALNMADLAETRGIKIDAEKMSELLDVPIVFTVGNKGKGIEDLLNAAIDLAISNDTEPGIRNVKYTKDIEDSIASLKTALAETTETNLPISDRWVAIKLLEDDSDVKEKIITAKGGNPDKVLEEAAKLRQFIKNRYDEDPQIVMTDERYGFIAGIVKEVMTSTTKQRIDFSRNIDLVLTNRFWGFPIFIFFIWAMFQLTFTLGEIPMGWLESLVSWVSFVFETILPDGLLKELIVDGAIAGVGSIIVFLPNILILFFCIALFEDTGYMARAAFLMDRIMHLIGLHGKSFIPMLMGFGCSVPAIMAARSLESEKDRILTILITPFMSCSARLPVYIVLAGTFFASKAGSVIFGIYLFGIILSILFGRLFRTVLLPGEDAPFVMELPPYRVPMAKSLMIHMWDRSKMFLKKMGKIILIGSIIVWGLSAFPRHIEYSTDYDAKIAQINTDFDEKIKTSDDKEFITLKNEMLNRIIEIDKLKSAEKAEKSYMGRLGKFIEPVFEPIGIDWRGSVALLTGFFAKEIVISTMGVLYAVEENDEPDALKHALKESNMTPLSAMAMMVFVLLYVPCLATVGTIMKEASVKWAIFSAVFTTLTAWGAAFVVFQGGRLFGLG